MTKRLTTLGFAAVAVVWGPYVYAELVREPLPAASVEPSSPIIETTPVVYESPAAERAQLLAALAEARENSAAQPSDTDVAPRDAPEPPGGAQPAAATSTTVAAAIDPAAPAAPELPQVQAPRPAAADPAARLAQPMAAAAPPTESLEPEAPAAEAHAADDDSAKEPALADAKHEPAEETESDDSHEETKHAEAADAPTPENLAPAFRSTFDRESRDAAWANGEEPRLTKLLAGAGVPESAISEVRCQSTVCRIALNSVDVKAVQQSPLYQLISSRVKDEFGTLGLDTSGEGEQHAAFYILRKGYELEH